MLLTERADLGIRTSAQHILFNSKSVNSQPKFGNVAKDNGKDPNKLTEAHRVISQNLTSHQVRVCQTIQRRQKEEAVALSKRVVKTQSGINQLNWKGPMPYPH
eukprot:839385-Pelagomonas_calceolata.AAC.1